MAERAERSEYKRPEPGHGVHRAACAHARTNLFTPQPHQLRVAELFVDDPARRGLLLYHKLGSGKTCTAILTSDALMNRARFTQVYVLSPGALRANYVAEYCQVCGGDEQRLAADYTFISYNANVRRHLPPSFDDSIVVIDEVHVLVNGVCNFSKNAAAIYSRLLAARGVKILALTGTPVYNHLYELAPLFNLLAPGRFPQVLDPRRKRVKTAAFDLLFANERAFRAKLKGLVSYVGDLYPELYPEIVYHPPIRAEMTLYQTRLYAGASRLECTLLGMGEPAPALRRANPEAASRQSSLYVMARQHILTRSKANFAYPREVRGRKAIEPVKPGADLGEDFAGPPDRLVAQGGWVERSEFVPRYKLSRCYSPKFSKLLHNIGTHFAGKHMVFSFFKTRAGVELIGALLEMCGLPVAYYTGDMNDAKRSATLARFNDAANAYGDTIKVLLVTHAGALGITLKGVQHVHIVESDPNEVRIRQTIGRAARMRSHLMLEPQERVVNVWRYWSVYADRIDPIAGRNLYKTPAIDEYLYRKGMKQYCEFEKVDRLLREESIEAQEPHSSSPRPLAGYTGRMVKS